ncbi:MAG: uroporphyrinogen-III C-methyltransferase [Acidiferrobacterales bacterium]
MVDKEQDQAPAAQQLTPQTEEGPADRAENANETKVPKPHGGRAWAGLAIVLSFIALAASGYVAYTLYQKQALLDADVLGTLEQLKASVQQMEKNESQVEREVERIKKQFSDAKHVQDTLASAIEKITNELGRNRTGWALAEIEQLLLIANYRLQLAHDPDTAIAALLAADRRLQQLAEPRLLPIRKLVATEITQLQSLERADVPGIALKLGSLADGLQKLPLNVEDRFRPPPPPAQAESETGAGSTFWGVLRQIWLDTLGLVRIRKTTEVQKPLLAPEHDYFLRENLRLMLYGAQLAVLQADVTTYTQNIEAAQKWVSDYFDTDAQSVINVRQELSGLLDAKITVELPDISGSLTALRAVASNKNES